MISHARNLREVSVKSEVLPWDFQLKSDIPEKIRKDKTSRQIFYKAPSTDHHFYSLLEGSNPNMRISQENNPPRLIHGFVADFDLPITFERAKEAVASMKLKPTHIERSLGGNLRLLWQLEKPIICDDYDFCVALLTEAVDWLQLGLLPGLDEPAFLTPTRLMCNGGVWEALGHTAIPADDSQAFFVKASKSFNFQTADPILIPLDVVEAELKIKYPAFNWPSDFTVDSQGPSFWIPESTSPTSAILKPEGFISFAAHATKPFYPWSAILGADFVKEFAVKAIAKATSEIYWDGHKFWRRKFAKKIFTGLEMPELQNHFLTTARLSPKPDKTTGISQIAEALEHIYNQNCVEGAAPFVGRKDGVITFMNRSVLNTYVDNSVVPHGEPCPVWGAQFPFIAAMLDHMFVPTIQLDHILAWLKHAYTGIRRGMIQPGQNNFIMGEVASGKTLFNREIAGVLLGGYMDASNFLIRGGEFNSELFEVPMWVVDDETPGNSDSQRNNFAAMLKKSTANNTFRHNKKFQAATLTEWAGRIGCTTNLDHVSSRILGNMDNSSKDKTNLFRCNSVPFAFPSREVTIANIRQELPYFGRWLLDWCPSDICVPDSRFGYKSYQEPTLLSSAHQSSKVAPFKEILLEVFKQYFEDHKGAAIWSGTTVAVMRLILNNPMNESIFRSLKIEQIARYLEHVARDEARFTSKTGEAGERLWVFTP